MIEREWPEIEAILDGAAALDDDGLRAWLERAPDDVRRLAGALLNDGPEFGSWAAAAAARIIESTPRIAVPSTLGHYRIARHIATGGMGEVYEAEDPRLKREVAIKVLHAGAIRRLDEEAQSLARLRHPNICRIYDVGRAHDVEYFVMELLDGAPLSDRLRKGPLGVAEALSMGRALASALAEAHRLGIVHRDVKPANILLTRNGPSLVDFGIAAAAASGGAIPAGTPPYMAPEQARGLSDPRSDIYSLGAVLREMVGDGAPAPMQNVITSCLREDPEERWQSAADLARALDWLVEPVRASVPAPWWRRWWIGYAAAGTVAALALFWSPNSLIKPHFPVLVPLRAPNHYTIQVEAHVAVSPDSTRVAFVAPDETGQTLVWIRGLGEMKAEAIPGTEGASLVFWSPDGKSIGFVQRGGQIKTRDLGSGTLRTVAERVPLPPLRAIWGEDDHILYSTNNLHREGVIYRIGVAAGTLQRVTALNDAEEELRHCYQALLPGGDKFLFVADSNRVDGTADGPGQTYLASFRNPGSRALLMRGAFPAGVTGDRVYFVRENKLWSRRLHVADGRWIDERRLEIPDVEWATVTPSGAVTYMPAPTNSRPAWVDRQGRKLSDVPVPEGQTIAVGLSRDGTALVTRQEDQGAGIGLWVVRGQDVQRIGSGPGRYIFPRWSADGKWIYFAGYDGPGLHRQLPDPGAEDELVMPRDREDAVISTTTRDGRYAFGVAIDASNNRGFDIIRFDLLTRTRQDWSATAVGETQPSLSPDDQWVAWLCEYSVDLRGRLCVSPREDPRSVSYVTTAAASEPEWSRDGKKLYFTSGGWLHSIPISVERGRVIAGAPERLFQLVRLHRFGSRFAVESDNRFLVREIYRPPPDPILVWNPAAK